MKASILTLLVSCLTTGCASFDGAAFAQAYAEAQQQQAQQPVVYIVPLQQQPKQQNCTVWQNGNYSSVSCY